MLVLSVVFIVFLSFVILALYIAIKKLVLRNKKYQKYLLSSQFNKRFLQLLIFFIALVSLGKYVTDATINTAINAIAVIMVFVLGAMLYAQHCAYGVKK